MKFSVKFFTSNAEAIIDGEIKELSRSYRLLYSWNWLFQDMLSREITLGSEYVVGSVRELYTIIYTKILCLASFVNRNDVRNCHTYYYCQALIHINAEK